MWITKSEKKGELALEKLPLLLQTRTTASALTGQEKHNRSKAFPDADTATGGIFFPLGEY